MCRLHRQVGFGAAWRYCELHIDAQSIHALAHRCEPENCAHRQSCCATYEVAVGSEEIGTIVGVLPDAARFQPELLTNGEPLDPFDETDGGACLNTDEHGRCVFAFSSESGAPLCSLHAAALELGLPPMRTKPRACALWPLALTEDAEPTLSVQPGAYDFACNRPRRDAERQTETLDPGVAALIRDALGEAALQRVLGAVAGR